MVKKIQVLAFTAYLFFITSLSFGFEIVKEAKVDLDGDGKRENISILIQEETYFWLKVDKTSIKGELYRVDGFTIIDIDTTDKYKEIAVHTPEDSGYDVYIVYGYDGTSIKEMGKLVEPTFCGNGIVLVDSWMGFWHKRDKYILNKKTRTLQLIPQELYYVGVNGKEITAKTTQSFPIYKTRTSSEVVANLKINSKILILACEPSHENWFDDWYLIKSETGLLGWARLKSFHDKVEGLPWAG